MRFDRTIALRMVGWAIVGVCLMGFVWLCGEAVAFVKSSNNLTFWLGVSITSVLAGSLTLVIALAFWIRIGDHKRARAAWAEELGAIMRRIPTAYAMSPDARNKIRMDLRTLAGKIANSPAEAREVSFGKMRVVTQLEEPDAAKPQDHPPAG